jgi:hypothetical protein
MDWRRGCRDILQQPTNADEFDENGRGKAYSFTLENEKKRWGKKNILLHCGLDRGLWNWGEIGKLHFYIDILNIAVDLKPFLLVASRMLGGGTSRWAQHTLLNQAVLL